MGRVCCLVFLILFSRTVTAQTVAEADSGRSQEKVSRISWDMKSGTDKMRHFNASLMAALAWQKTMEETSPRLSKPAFSISFSLSLGLIKELYDLQIKKSSISIGDLIADIAGAGCGLFIGNLR